MRARGQRVSALNPDPPLRDGEIDMRQRPEGLDATVDPSTAAMR